MIRTLQGDSLSTGSWITSRCAWNPLAVFDSECWAATYEALQYGRITRPGDVQQPVPSAPQTAAEMTDGSWSPQDGLIGMYPAYYARLQAQIAADEAAGSYVPEGRLPGTASDLSAAWDRYKFWLLGGAAVIAGAVVIGGHR